MTTDQMIPTLAMARDPRLRRLFALVGRALADDELFAHEDDIRDVMLTVAPEYLPPDNTDVDFSDDEIAEDWRALVGEALRR